MKRIIDVVLLFLGERELPLRGTSQRIGEKDNGNLLGVTQFLSYWDPILKENVLQVKDS